MFSSRACSTGSSSSCLCTRHTGTVWPHLGDLLFLLFLLKLILLHLLHNMRRGWGIVSQATPFTREEGSATIELSSRSTHIAQYTMLTFASACHEFTALYSDGAIHKEQHSATMTTQCTPSASCCTVLQCIYSDRSWTFTIVGKLQCFDHTLVIFFRQLTTQ